ncbi:MAG: glycosyltransferase family 4 protein [Cyanobacteria bacterium P01_G01_bin.54]
MKILIFITRSDTLGGAQVHVKDLSIALQSHGHVVLVVTGHPGIFTDVLDSLGLYSTYCPSLQRSINVPKDIRCIFEMWNIIRTFDPDLVTLHSSKAGILGRIVSFFAGHKPCIFTVHGWGFRGFSRFKQLVLKLLELIVEPFADKIICVSNYDREVGLELGIPTRKLVGIHNGIPDVPRNLQARSVSTNPMSLVMVARMDIPKDHDTLLQAIQFIDNVELKLVGDGQRYFEIADKVERLGLSQKVELLGFRSNIPLIIVQSDVFVLISHWEGFPLTTLEAMRAGLPVIVSDVGGASEAVIEGQTGYCIPEGDVESLRNRIQVLADDPKLRKRMGQAARKHYEENFTFERMFQKTLTVYEEVLRSRGNRF